MIPFAPRGTTILWDPPDLATIYVHEAELGLQLVFHPDCCRREPGTLPTRQSLPPFTRTCMGFHGKLAITIDRCGGCRSASVKRPPALSRSAPAVTLQPGAA